jgi:transposase
MATYHVGVDLHKSVAQVCVLDAQGEVHRERRFAIPDRESAAPFLDWLAEFLPAGRLAVEALGCNRWFVNACQERQWDVLVADASKLQLRQSGKKTDRRDALEIARRLFLGDLDRCARTYYPTDVEYGRRQVMRLEHGQVQKRTETIAQIRGLLSTYKLTAPTKVLWSQKSIAWLRTLTLPVEDLTFSLQVLIDDLASVQQRILTLKKRIKQMAEADEEAKLWMQTLPSVGPQTALMVRAEIGDARRFRSARAVASYAGVVPRVTASADKSHHGGMTHRGNAHLRWIVGQWAVRLMSTNETVKAWARLMCRRMHKNKARVALAHRLIVGLWVMLKRGEAFSLERCLGLDRVAQPAAV